MPTTNRDSTLASLSRAAQVVGELRAAGAVAVVRLDRGHDVPRAIQAVVDGGITAVELTLTTPSALRHLAALRAHFGDAVCVGMGSIITEREARDAVAAGAQFLVSPVLERTVLSTGVALDVAVLPGASSPGELLAAHRAGAELVKLFPGEAVGPSYLKAVTAPMPFLQIMPTGGVTPDNAGEWIRAGAAVVGLGSSLVSPALVEAEAWPELTSRAQRTMASVRDAREGATDAARSSPPARP